MFFSHLFYSSSHISFLTSALKLIPFSQGKVEQLNSRNREKEKEKIV